MTYYNKPIKSLVCRFYQRIKGLFLFGPRFLRPKRKPSIAGVLIANRMLDNLSKMQGFSSYENYLHWRVSWWQNLTGF